MPRLKRALQEARTCHLCSSCSFDIACDFKKQHLRSVAYSGSYLSHGLFGLIEEQV